MITLVINSAAITSAGLFPWGDRRTAWVVLDNVERLSASIMAPLLSLARHTCAAINWVLISREAPMPGSPFMEGLPPDIPTRLTLLHFSPYTIPQLAQVPSMFSTLSSCAQIGIRCT